MTKRVLIVGLAFIGAVAVLLQLSLSLKQNDKFVMPSPYPTFDIYNATPIRIVLPPLLPVEIDISTEATANTSTIAKQRIPNWILGILSSLTPVPTFESSSTIDKQAQMVGPAQSLDECGDASVLYMKDSGADTGLRDDNSKIILYFNYDSQAYEVKVSDAEWVIDGERQKVNLLNEDEMYALSYGQVEYVCYYSRTAVTGSWFADVNVFSVQFKLNGPVLFFPSE